MDDAACFESLLSSLKKPQTGKRLLQILVALRKHVNTQNLQAKISVIKRQNCIAPLVNYTRYDGNVKVVDLALSILGNCCMDGTVVRHSVNDLNILHNLNRVLEKHKKDSIEGRVFRILGNLCSGYEPLKLIVNEPTLVNKVVLFLKNFNLKLEDDTHSNGECSEEDKLASVSTISMALRFVRKVLDRSTFDVLVKEHQLIKAVGIAFKNCSMFWIENKQNTALLNDILKILEFLSSRDFRHHDIILELKNLDGGNALEYFVDIISFDPLRIIKIILKYAIISKHQSDLPIEKIITNLINLVELSNEIRLQKQYLECINKLMGHHGFQDKLKSSDNIHRLIDILDKYNLESDYSVQCCIYICAILNDCKYNESLMRMSQLNTNIISIIIEKLQLITGKASNKVVVEKHVIRKKPNTPQTPTSKRFKYNNVEDDQLTNNFEITKDTDRCASPSSCSDVSSRGPFSPVSHNGLLFYGSDSDNYSPLCSDNEDEQYEIFIPDDEILSESEDKPPCANQSQVKLRFRLRDEINTLLKFYLSMKPLCSELGNTKLLVLLMNIVLGGSATVQSAGNSMWEYHLFDAEFSLLLSIAQTRDFLIPFMISGVISQIYEVMDTIHGDKCEQCEFLQSKANDVISKFVLVGQSESIKGDIAYILLGKAKDDVKQKIVLSIPYVIRNISVLNKLMMDCSGLNILIQLLRDESNAQTQEKSIKSICAMATDSLKIKNPVVKKQFKKHKLTENARTKGARVRVGCYASPDTSSNIVSFKLEDGSSVKADRDALNEKSDYFSTLLSGSFMESEQSEIALKNVSKDSLNCLLQLLKLDIELNCVLDFDYDIDTILDVVLLTDRFLLPDLNYMLICHIEQLIAVKTVPTFYKWAIESGTNIMRVESVAYALVGDISYRERLGMFRALFNLGYSFEFIGDVESLITRFL